MVEFYSASLSLNSYTVLIYLRNSETEGRAHDGNAANVENASFPSSNWFPVAQLSAINQNH